jgi:hypothetical protein
MKFFLFVELGIEPRALHMLGKSVPCFDPMATWHNKQLIPHTAKMACCRLDKEKKRRFLCFHPQTESLFQIESFSRCFSFFLPEMFNQWLVHE